MLAVLENKLFTFAFVLVAGLLLISACSSDDDANPGDADGDQEVVIEDSTLECLQDSDCGIGEFCSAAGMCLEECRTELDCPPNDYCMPSVSARCLDCLEDEHCNDKGDDAYCDMDYYKCRIGCDDCESDQVCVEDRCVTQVIDGDLDAETEGDLEEEGDTVEVFKCPNPEDPLLRCEPSCSECLTPMSARKCNEEGSGWINASCEQDEFCNSSTGFCEKTTCEAGEQYCEGNIARVCKDDGSGYRDTTCQQPNQCLDGACVILACKDSTARLFTLNARSAVGSPDRFCNVAVNRGSAQWAEMDNHGGVATFDGSSARMLLDSSAGDFQEGLTVRLDVLAAGDMSGNQTLIAKGNTPVSYELALEDGNVVFTLTISGGYSKRIEGAQLDGNTWHSITGTFDGLEMRLYIDGNQQGAPVLMQTKKLIERNPRIISIGARTQDSGTAYRYFEGSLDNIYLSGRALDYFEVDYFRDRKDLCPLSDEEDLYCNDDLCNRQYVSVPINEPWQEEGMDLIPGEAVFVDPGGCPDPQVGQACIGPQGLDNGSNCDVCPVTTSFQYSLIAKVGESGPPFYAGERDIYVANRFGALLFGYNDEGFSENLGGFNVLVENGYCKISECPDGMVPIPNKDACVDRYEASCATASYASSSTCSAENDDEPVSLPGLFPWTNITAEDAVITCARVGKRLCKSEEWDDSCAGYSELNYPYGDSYQSLYCNDNNYTSPLDNSDLTSTGYMYRCVTETGAFDMAGNAAEFVSKESGGFRAMAGKGFAGDNACYDRLDFSGAGLLIGFRCCMDHEADVEED